MLNDAGGMTLAAMARAAAEIRSRAIKPIGGRFYVGFRAAPGFDRLSPFLKRLSVNRILRHQTGKRVVG